MVTWTKYDAGRRIERIDENPITHKALAKLHAKLDRIERTQSRIIAWINHMNDGDNA